VIYYYVVSAVNSVGESGNSSQVSATPQAAPAPPPMPTGLVAAAGINQVSLQWSAAAGATSYHVQRATTNGGPYTTIASPTSTSYVDSGLTAGVTYYYVVSAVNSAGESGNSSQVSATPQAAPLPTAPTLLNAQRTGRTNINLTWTQSSTPGITQNNVYRRTSGGTYPATPTVTLVGGSSSYIDRGLARSTTYCYVVTAVNSAGESPRSNEACAQTR
jgi:cellulose 1,4-beta-cellobiosidase